MPLTALKPVKKRQKKVKIRPRQANRPPHKAKKMRHNQHGKPKKLMITYRSFIRKFLKMLTMRWFLNSTPRPVRIRPDSLRLKRTAQKKPPNKVNSTQKKAKKTPKTQNSNPKRVKQTQRQVN